MLQTTRGVVLHTLKYSDTTLIVDVYTETIGRVSLALAASRSRKSPTKAVLFQPLSLVELEVDIRSGTTLHRIKEAKSDYPFASIPFDPYKSAIALFVAEFLYRAVREETENRPLFAYLQHSIVWLDACRSSFANFHLVFLMRLSRFLGLYPNLDDFHAGDYFDLLNGCFTADRPQQHALYLQPDEAARLNRLMRMNYETMHLFVMNRVERNRCLTIINEYYRLHVPNFPLLHSLDVLRELFD
ncbi:MAG: DNA repair protein RecO [Prevotellaceae bacterium]|jgi:DNA repair protein RecO (recombination protein O)|nr:DNA repair protein RecO [Prevotellaceae bacterium]